MICVHCDYEFDPKSTLKRMAGGKINECADCVEELGTEVAVKYTGSEAEGTGSFSISRHSSNEGRDKFMKDLKNGVNLSR